MTCTGWAAVALTAWSGVEAGGLGHGARGPIRKSGPGGALASARRIIAVSPACCADAKSRSIVSAEPLVASAVGWDPFARFSSLLAGGGRIQAFRRRRRVAGGAVAGGSGVVGRVVVVTGGARIAR